MKGWKIDLQPYNVTVRKQSGEEVVETDGPLYNVRESLYAILTSVHLQMNGSQLLKNATLGARLRDYAEDSILVDNTEYEQLKAAINAIRGLSHAEVEFARRVLEVEEVDTDQSC